MTNYTLSFLNCLRTVFMAGAGYGDLQKISDTHLTRWHAFELPDVGSFKAMDELIAEANDRPKRKFKKDDRVQKRSGSSWHGRVVGFYSTKLTPIGYVVESDREEGSAQLYPEAALEPGADVLDHTKNLSDWVEAALQCKSWNWDGDQFEAALHVLNDYRKSVGEEPFKHGRDDQPELCEDEGCDHYGTPHVCISRPDHSPKRCPVCGTASHVGAMNCNRSGCTDGKYWR